MNEKWMKSSFLNLFDNGSDMNKNFDSVSLMIKKMSKLKKYSSFYLRLLDARLSILKI